MGNTQRVLSRIISAIALLSFTLPLVAGTLDTWQNGPITDETIAKELSHTKERLTALAADGDGEKNEKITVLLNHRKKILESFSAIRSQKNELTAKAAEFQQVKNKLESEMETINAATLFKSMPAKIDDQVTFLSENIARLLEEKQSIEDQERDMRKAINSSTEKIKEKKDQITDLENKISALQKDLQNEYSDEIKLNTHIEKSLLNEEVHQLSLIVDESPNLTFVRGLELSLLDKKLKIFQTAYDEVSSKLKTKIKNDSKEIAALLNLKKIQKSQATQPSKSFLLTLEIEELKVKADSANLQKTVTALETQYKNISEDLTQKKEEIRQLEQYVSSTNNTEKSAKRLKLTFERVMQRKTLDDKSAEIENTNTIDQLREKQFELDELLSNFDERYDHTLISRNMDGAEKQEFEEKAITLENNYKKTLLSYKQLLVKSVGTAIKIEEQLIEREDTFSRLEAFVLSRVFWIQDAKPINTQTIKLAFAEAKSLSRKFSQQIATGFKEDLVKIAGNLNSFIMFIIIFLALPVMLIYIRQKLSQFLNFSFKKYLSKTNASHQSKDSKWLPVILALVSSLILPSYLWITAGILGIPFQEVSTTNLKIVQATLFFAGCILLIVIFRRYFLRREMLIKNIIALDNLSVTQLKNLVDFLTLTTCLFLFPIYIFEILGLDSANLIRLSKTIFAISLFAAIYYLLYRQSPLLQQIKALSSRNFILKNINVIRNLLLIVIPFLILLDIWGYRFGAHKISGSFYLTILFVISISIVYDLLNPKITNFIMKRYIKGEDDENPDLKANRSIIRNSISKYTQIFISLLTIIVLAKIWGIDERAIEALKEVILFSFHANSEIINITLADLMNVIASMAVAIIFIKNIGVIFQILIFSRFQFDSGLRYAIVTIVRYLAICIALLTTLSLLKIDLKNLSWLAAAVGLGLGFGLQEIVSNFVCGLILLIERPIRVSDTVTVADTTGIVQKINIRATTILNLQRQEVVVPNKSLIVEKVINWTLADNVIRISTEIGVAYGSNISEVKKLLREVAAKASHVIKKPAPEVLFTSHGDSSLNFEVRVFIKDPFHRFLVIDELNEKINEALMKNKITIPFPQRDVHIYNHAGTMQPTP